MYTKDDYFTEDDSYRSPADYAYESHKEDHIYSLNKTLHIIGCRQTEASEYEHDEVWTHGLEAKPYVCTEYPYPAEQVDHTNFTPKWIRKDMYEFYDYDCYAMDLQDVWNAHYDVLDQLFDLLVKYASRIPWHIWYEDLDARGRRTLDRFCAIRDRYNAEIDKALGEMCRMVESWIDGDYEYDHSDEAAEQWVAEMQWEAEVRRKAAGVILQERRELAFESMENQTAAFAGYMV